MSPARWLEPGSSDWIEVLSTVQHDFYHLPQYVALEAHRLGGLPRLFTYMEQDSCLLCPLVIRSISGHDGKDAVSPYGYPGPLVTSMAETGFVQRASRRLVEALSEFDLVSAFIRLHPLLSPEPHSLASGADLASHGPTVSIDLRDSEATMWGQIRPGHRSEIRRAREKEFRFAIDPHWNDIGHLLAIYEETMVAVGAEPEYFFSRTYFESLRDLDGARTYLATVRIDDEPAAAAVFVEVGGLVQYHLSGARNAFRRQQPTKFLLDQVRRWAAHSGHHTLHLGGGVGGREDSLYDFKAGFSKRRHLFATWRIVADTAAYEGLCKATGVDPKGSFFPAYRQPG